MNHLAPMTAVSFFAVISAFFSGSGAWSLGVGETVQISDLGFINSDVLFQLCPTGGLRWSHVELFVGGRFAFLLRVSSGDGAWRRVGSASSRFLAVRLSCRRSSEALGWLEICLQLGAQAALSLSVKLLWSRYGSCRKVLLQGLRTPISLFLAVTGSFLRSLPILMSKLASFASISTI
ncbi:hypothetical protein YC2023_070938 [Brassica napus]